MTVAKIFQVFEQIPEEHHCFIEMLLTILAKAPEQILPVSTVLKKLQHSKVHLNTLAELNSCLCQTEKLGIFCQVRTESINQPQSQLQLTILGRELAEFYLVITIARSHYEPDVPRWIPRTLWRIETYIRTNSSLAVNSAQAYAIEDLAAEIILRSTEFGLRRLTRLDTTCQLVLDVFHQRFLVGDEICLTANQKHFYVKRSLA